MPSHAPRLALPYVDISGICRKWAARSLQFAVYEHAADAQVKTTHCHLLMIGCDVDREALKRQFRKELPQFKDLSGNSLWSWEHDRWKLENPGKEYDLGMIKYMSKGRLAPAYVSNIDEATLAQERGRWTVRSNDVQQKDKKAASEWDKLLASFRNLPNNKSLDMGQIKKWIKSSYLSKGNCVPRDGDSKRYAYSLYAIIHQKTRYEDIDGLDYNEGLYLTPIAT